MLGPTTNVIRIRYEATIGGLTESYTFNINVLPFGPCNDNPWTYIKALPYFNKVTTVKCNTGIILPMEECIKSDIQYPDHDWEVWGTKSKKITKLNLRVTTQGISGKMEGVFIYGRDAAGNGNYSFTGNGNETDLDFTNPDNIVKKQKITFKPIFALNPNAGNKLEPCIQIIRTDLPFAVTANEKYC